MNLCNAFGSMRKAAVHLGINVSSISRWESDRDGNIPLDYIPEIMALSSKLELDLNVSDIVNKKVLSKHIESLTVQIREAMRLMEAV